MKRRCNLCLRSVDHLRTDKWENNEGYTCTLCYDCQKVIKNL